MKFIAKLGLAFALIAPSLASAEVSVVKIINFSCQFCRSSEAMDEPIRKAVTAAGGKMVYATLPADEASDGSRELVYYAARTLIPGQEPRIRDSLYKGAQDLGYPLMTTGETTEWLSTDLADLKYDWTLVRDAAASRATRESFERAIRLTIKAGAQVLPSYVIVKDGEIFRTLDVDSSGNSYSALREAVLTAITNANASKGASK